MDNLHAILRALYQDMMPLCSEMTTASKTIAGLGGLFYIAYRIWQQLARAEPIDVFPLLRPFAILLCITFFPTIVIGTINSILSPVVTGTNSLLSDQTFSLEEYQKQKDLLEYEALKRNPETAYLVDSKIFDQMIDDMGISDVGTMAGMYIERAMYNMQRSIQNFFRAMLECIFMAVSLMIDVLRTFFLIVLTILGPLVFALSSYDGFQNNILQWLSRYIYVYLWLPVSDIFSSILAQIQILMLKNDITEMENNPGFDPSVSNIIYIVFMIIGIIGYFSIPIVSGWIVQAGSMSGMGRNISNFSQRSTTISSGVIGSVTGNITGRLIKRFKK